jgi:hypothetical protein
MSLRDELIDDIKLKLGYPVVRVEIDDTQWDAIIKKSIRWFKAKKGIIRCGVINIISGQNEYEWPPDCDGIVDIILPASDGGKLFPGMCDLDTNLVPTWVYGYGWNSGNPVFDVSSYVMLQQNLDSRRRVFNSEINWYEACGKIYLTSQSIQPGQAIVFYKKKTVVLEDFIGRDVDLIQRYIEAIAKHVLGQIRSKYSQYPSAGGTISTDGPELLASAKEEMDKLEEEISGSQGNAGGLVRGA